MSTQPNEAGVLIPAQPRRLRDCTEAQFEEIYDCDRFTAMVLSNRLRSVFTYVSSFAAATLPLENTCK